MSFCRVRPIYLSVTITTLTGTLQLTCSLGLQIIPSLLSLSTQKALLLRLWIRALSDPLHQTNLHLHYDIPYPDAGVQSFFHYSDPEHVLLKPKDPDIHKPLSVAQMIKKKLRWMTLGGQYDWTRKVYPELDSRQPRNLPVPFPRDTAKLINSLVCFTHSFN